MGVYLGFPVPRDPEGFQNGSRWDKFLRVDKKTDAKALAVEIIKTLDTNNDGKISKDEFVNGLLKNYSIR